MPNEYWTPLIGFLPDRFPEPDAKLLDHQTAPARQPKVADLVDHDEKVKKNDDLEKDENDAKGVQEHSWRYWVRS